MSESEAFWLIRGRDVVYKEDLPDGVSVEDVQRVVRDFCGDVRKPSSCWRCGAKGPHYDSKATMSLSMTDGSYSGTFDLPLCFRCGQTVRDHGRERR